MNSFNFKNPSQCKVAEDDLTEMMLFSEFRSFDEDLFNNSKIQAVQPSLDKKYVSKHSVKIVTNCSHICLQTGNWMILAMMTKMEQLPAQQVR